MVLHCVTNIFFDIIIYFLSKGYKPNSCFGTMLIIPNDPNMNCSNIPRQKKKLNANLADRIMMSKGNLRKPLLLTSEILSIVLVGIAENVKDLFAFIIATLVMKMGCNVITFTLYFIHYLLFHMNVSFLPQMSNLFSNCVLSVNFCQCEMRSIRYFFKSYLNFTISHNGLYPLYWSDLRVKIKLSK